MIQKIILKVLDSVPASPAISGAEQANLHKLKSFYDSCKNIVRFFQRNMEAG
jgi:hypothetical protein